MKPKRIRTVEGSCWLCKDRRVLCDLQQPRCSRCISKGEQCDYGEVRLRWCNGVAARGRYAGQNVPVSVPVRKSSLLCSHEGTQLSSSPPSHEQERDGNSPAEQNSSPVSCNVLQPSSRLSLQVTTEQLLPYFANIVVDRFNLSTGQISINLSSVYKAPALRDSVNAVASAHQISSLYSGSPHVKQVKNKARWNAIHNFRALLQCPDSDSEAPGLDLFMANVLLCILDGVIDPHDESAATHMHYRGGRAILSQWKLHGRLRQEKRGLPALMLSIFATMDLTYSMLNGEEQYFQHTIWNSLSGSDGWWGTLSQGDPFLEILSVLSRLARLGSLMYKGLNPLPEDAINEEVSALLIALRGPLQIPDDVSCLERTDAEDQLHPFSSPFPSPDHLLDHDQSWTVFCNAYRITGLIYAYRVFYRTNVNDPSIQHAMNLGMQAVCKTRLSGKLSHCLLFPALVIGCHCRAKEDQMAILATIRSSAQFLRFGSLRVMESFLQEVWERDLVSQGWWDCFQPISKRAFLF